MGGLQFQGSRRPVRGRLEMPPTNCRVAVGDDALARKSRSATPPSRTAMPPAGPDAWSQRPSSAPALSRQRNKGLAVLARSKAARRLSGEVPLLDPASAMWHGTCFDLSLPLGSQLEDGWRWTVGEKIDTTARI
jgi:hypothetical protein